MQNMPFIPQSPSQSEMNVLTPGSQSSVTSGSTMFNFAGLSSEKLEMKNYPDYTAAAEEDESKPQDSDKAASETSEQQLAQLREQFKRREVQYKKQIQQLTGQISSANENCREKATELSFAYASTQNEYGHLETSVREQIMKKDL